MSISGNAVAGQSPLQRSDLALLICRGWAIADLGLTPDGDVVVLGRDDNGLTVTKLGF